MKGDFFMAKTKKSVRPLWVVLTQGGLISLCVYFLGVLGLSALVVNGTAGEGGAPGVLAALCGIASFAGALLTVRKSGVPALGILAAGIFIAAVGIAGLACWGKVSLVERGCGLASAALIGGGIAGIAGRRRRGKRIHR